MYLYIMTKKTKLYGLSPQTLDEIRQARIRKGLTQEDVADNLGKTRVTYNRLETGQMNVLCDTLQGACRELDLEPHVYLAPKGETTISMHELLDELKAARTEIERMKAEICRMEKENASLAFQVELLKENRNLRKDAEN